MEDLSRDWHNEIKHCVREYSDKKTKLWSFEVKDADQSLKRERSLLSDC